MPRTFEFLMNDFEAAAHDDAPADVGYAEKRRAVFQHVEDLWDDYMRLLREKQDRLIPSAAPASLPEDSTVAKAFRLLRRRLPSHGTYADEMIDALRILELALMPKPQSTVAASDEETARTICVALCGAGFSDAEVATVTNIMRRAQRSSIQRTSDGLGILPNAGNVTGIDRWEVKSG